MPATFQPNTGTELGQGRTNSGLSTQIIIKIDGNAVGAIQELTVSQDRSLAEVGEVGTDGLIEVVPNGPTKYSIRVSRMVFDQMRLPEAFSRAFRFIAAQRVPFDIDVIDRTAGGEPVVMTYKNCWFSRMETPYRQNDYLITESADLKCETAYISSGTPTNARGIGPNETMYSGDPLGVERSVNTGGRRGSLDAANLFADLYKGSGT